MSLKQTRRTGIDPLAYMGIDSISPLNLVRMTRAPRHSGDPLGDDIKEFNVGDFWLDTSPIAPNDPDLWMLTKKHNNIAYWARVVDITNLALVFEDALGGTAQPNTAGEVNFVGSGPLSSQGSGNTVTYNITNGTNGQILICGGATPTWGTITSSDGSVLFTPGPNTLSIRTIGTSGLDFIDTDAGAVSPVLGEIVISGVPSLPTSAAGSTITIDLANSIVINELTLSALPVGVVQTDATGLFFSDNGANGEVIIGGGLAPAWNQIASADGSIIITHPAPNTINLEAIPATGIDTLSDDAAVTVTPLLGNVAVEGGSNIITTGDDVKTITVGLTNDVSISGTLTLSLSGAGVVQSNALGDLFSDNGTNGQLLIGGGLAPAWNNLDSADLSITIVDGVNSIDIKAGTPLGNHTLTGDNAVAATPLASVITIAGGQNFVTAGDNNHTIYVNLATNIDIPGTLTLSALTAGVVQIDASHHFTSSNGTNGQLLIGGGTAPAWNSVTSSDGSITITPGAGTLSLALTVPHSGGTGLGSHAFLAHQPSAYVTGNLVYYLGSSVALTEVFDTGGDFFPGDGAGSPAVYTAPSDGKYFFGYNLIAIYVSPPPPPPTPPVYDPPVVQTIRTESNATPIVFYPRIYTTYAFYSPGLVAQYISGFTELDAGDITRFTSAIDFVDAGIDGDATELRTFVCGYKVV